MRSLSTLQQIWQCHVSHLSHFSFPSDRSHPCSFLGSVPPPASISALANDPQLCPSPDLSLWSCPCIWLPLDTSHSHPNQTQHLPWELSSQSQKGPPWLFLVPTLTVPCDSFHFQIPLALRCASNSTALAKAPSPWPNCDCGCLPFVACASFSPRLGTALFTPTAVGEAPRRCLSSAPATPHPCSASLGHTAQLAYLCETLSLVASCLAIWLSHQILPLRAELGVGGVQKTPAHLC